jgi:hypothetical protein
MELSDLIPDNNKSWAIKGKYLMFKKYENIPVCFIDDDIVYVFLDSKIHNVILKITKHLMCLGHDFYFTTPLLSIPKRIETLNKVVIENYFNNYSNKYFFRGFNDIGFDLIYNMVKWTEKEDCFDLVKEIYDKIEKKVNYEHNDWYSNRKYYEYDEDIRESFRGLYRDIQISKIL